MVSTPTLIVAFDSSRFFQDQNNPEVSPVTFVNGPARMALRRSVNRVKNRLSIGTADPMGLRGFLAMARPSFVQTKCPTGRTLMKSKKTELFSAILFRIDSRSIENTRHRVNFYRATIRQPGQVVGGGGFFSLWDFRREPDYDCVRSQLCGLSSNEKWPL